MRRRKDKIDANQTFIVNELKKKELSVEVGHDDILVGYYGRTYWFEIKNPDKISKKTGLLLESALEDDQIRLRRDFKGHYRIVTHLWQVCLEIGITYQVFGGN